MYHDSCSDIVGEPCRYGTISEITLFLLFPESNKWWSSSLKACLHPFNMTLMHVHLPPQTLRFYTTEPCVRTALHILWKDCICIFMFLCVNTVLIMNLHRVLCICLKFVTETGRRERHRNSRGLCGWTWARFEWDALTQYPLNIYAFSELDGKKNYFKSSN